MKKEAWEHEVEELLGRLRPAEPPRKLLEALSEEPPAGGIQGSRIVSGPWGRMTTWVGATAAAAAVLALWLSPGGGEKRDGKLTGAGQELKRGVELTSREHLLKVDDLGVMDAGEEGWVRLLRTTWVDEIEVGSGEEKRTEARLRQEVVPVGVTIY